MGAVAMRRLPVVSEPPRPRLVALPGGLRALDETVASGWSQLRAGRTVSCVLCGGAMAPRWSAGAGVIGGRCSDCGTELE